MIENNDSKPKKESELDITELLRRYMPEEYASDGNDGDANADTTEDIVDDNEDDNIDDDVKEYGVSPKKEKTARPRRRLSARRHLEDAEEDVLDMGETVDKEEPANEPVDVIEAPESVQSELTAEAEVSEEMVMPETADAPDEIEADVMDILASGEFEPEETTSEAAAPEHEQLNIFDIPQVEPEQIKERSFDPDVDIFSEFEDPRDELYDYIDEAFAKEEPEVDFVETVTDESEADEDEDTIVAVDAAEAETDADADAEGNGETMVFTAVAPAAEAEEEIEEDEDFEVEPEAESEADESEDGEMNDFDLNIMLALGMEDELEETVGVDRVTQYVERQQGDIAKATNLNRERAALEYEFTNKSQVREVIGAYQTAYRNSKIKLIYGAALAFILLLFECHASFGIKLTGAFDPTLYPVVYIMVGFQLLVLIAAPAAKSLYTGFLDFFRGKPSPESVAAVAVLLDVIYTVTVSFVSDFGEVGLVTFNFPVAVGLLMMYVYEILNLRREILSFSIVSSKKPKYALQSLTMTESQLEYDAFSDMMEEDDDADDIGVLKIECADFVNDYFLRTNRYPSGRKFLGFVIPAAIVIAAAFFAYKYSDAGVYGGMKAAVTTALICLPASVFYMFSHPFYTASEKAHEDECTIIGEGSAEEYADAAIISFDDKNVFPSTNVNVRAINVFGNNRIDRVLYYAASTFCTVGGPLSDVFDLATRDIGYSTDVKLMRTLPGLLETEVDGSVIAFGTIDALEAAGVKIPKPLEAHRADAFEPTVSVMYMVKDGKFIARMLISYLVDSDFEFIIKQLDRSGMFIGMKTFDPNITEQFIGAQIKLADYPIRVIRCKSLDDKTQVSEATGSGLISKDSPKSVLQTVTLCEKVLHARSINTMILIISLFVGLLVAALSILFGAMTLSPLFIALYSIFWVVPMFIVSKVII